MIKSNFAAILRGIHKSKVTTKCRRKLYLWHHTHTHTVQFFQKARSFQNRSKCIYFSLCVWFI